MERIRSTIAGFAQQRYALFVIPLVCFGLIFTPAVALAGFTEMILNGVLLLVSWLIMDLYVPLIGSLMTIFMQLVVRIAMYNSFGTATAVVIGWVLLRDIANMLLVVILLSMAFGTLLNQEKLGTYKKLPLFAVMAVVINFSKMITLLIIDVSQVVMLSFVAAFQNTAAGNFVRAFGIRDWFTLENIGASGEYRAQAAVAMALAAILVTVAAIVLLVMLLYLIARIVLLWILIILSPLAFALKILPGKGEGYYADWWKKLTETLIIGPMLAFFLWLTLIVAGVSNGAIGSEVLSDSSILTSAHNAEVQNSGAQSELQIKSRKGAALTPDTLVTFMLTIIMLLLGLKISIDAGGVVGKGVSGFAKKLPRRTLKGLRMGWKTGKAVSFGSARLVGRARFPGGATLGEVVSVRLDQLKEWNPMSKMKQERASNIRKAKYMRSIGKGAEARKLEQQVILKDREGLKGLSQDQLLSKFKGAESGSMEHKAAALELAETGYFKDRPESIEKAAAGDEDLMKQLIEATGTDGAKMMGMSASDRNTEIERTMASQTDSKNRSYVGRLAEEMKITVGIDGKEEMAHPGVVTKAKGITGEMYAGKGSSDAFRSQIDKGLLLGIRNTDGDDRQALISKFNELRQERHKREVDRVSEYNSNQADPSKHKPIPKVPSTISFDSEGVVAGRTKEAIDMRREQYEMYDVQAKDLANAGAKNVRSVDGVVASGDVAVSDGVRKMSGARKKDVRANIAPGLQQVGHDMDAKIRAYKDSVSSGGSPAPIDAWNEAAHDVENFRTELRNHFSSMSGSTGELKEDGSEKTWEEVFDDGTLRKMMDDYAKALRRRNNYDPAKKKTTAGKERAKKEASRLDPMLEEMRKNIDAMSQDMMTGRTASVRDVTRGNEGARKRTTKQVDRSKGVQSVMTSRLAQAKSTTSAGERGKYMKEARAAAVSTAKALSGNRAGVVPEVTKEQIKQVRDEIKKFDVSSGDVAEFEKLINRLDKLGKSMR